MLQAGANRPQGPMLRAVVRDGHKGLCYRRAAGAVTTSARGQTRGKG